MQRSNSQCTYVVVQFLVESECVGDRMLFFYFFLINSQTLLPYEWVFGLMFRACEEAQSPEFGLQLWKSMTLTLSSLDFVSQFSPPPPPFLSFFLSLSLFLSLSISPTHSFTHILIHPHLHISLYTLSYEQVPCTNLQR